MKKTLFLFASFLVCFVGNAQELSISKGKLTYKRDYVECWKVMVEPETNTIKREWKSYIKKSLDFKLKGFGLLSNRDVLEAEDVLVEKISSKRVDFFTRIIESDGQTEMAIFAKHGKDSYFNDDDSSKEFKSLKKILTGFLKSYLPKYYDERVEEANKRISKLVENGEDLENTITSNKEKIEELTKENESLAKEIEENKLNITSGKEEFVKRDEKRKKMKELLKKIQ